MDGSQVPISYLALGDSYTLGEGINIKENFPNLLAKTCNTFQLPVEEPKVVAQTGWTTDELLLELSQTELSPPYDLISLLIGVNNQYEGYDLDIYKEEFTQLLQQAIAWAKDISGVFVLSIPDYGCTPFALKLPDPGKIGAEIDAFNQVNRSIAEAFDILYFDITPITRDLADVGMLAPDQLHYSKAMYQSWVDIIYHPLALKLKG